jgi:hypothetical protein
MNQLDYSTYNLNERTPEPNETAEMCRIRT